MKCKTCPNITCCHDNNEPYCDDILNKYNDYLLYWYQSHNEGDPVCLDEWFNNEYMEEE